MIYEGLDEVVVVGAGEFVDAEGAGIVVEAGVEEGVAEAGWKERQPEEYSCRGWRGKQLVKEVDMPVCERSILNVMPFFLGTSLWLS